MDHVFPAVLIPFALAALVYFARRRRAGLPLLIGTPAAMCLCALWAEVPDLPRLVGLHDLYLRLRADPRMDIFLWHYTIDQRDAGSRWYTVGVVILAAALFAAVLRELFREEEER